MKIREKPLSGLEAGSTMSDLAQVFFKTIDGLYVLFWTALFWTLGLLAVFAPSLRIQQFAQPGLLFGIPLVMMIYLIWHRLGNSLLKKTSLAFSLFNISIFVVVPFYKFLFG